MTDLSEEAKGWYEQARKRVRPYGFMEVGRGVLVLSAAKNGGMLITDTVVGQGHMQWLIVNRANRELPLEVVVSLQEERIRFMDECTMPETIEGTEKGESIYVQVDVSRQFEVRQDGSQTVLTQLVRIARKCRPGRTSFFVKRGDTMGAQMDWLGFLGKLAAAAPGVGKLVDPFLRLYDQERADHSKAALNAKLDEHFSHSHQLHATMLAHIARVDHQANEIMVAVETCATLLTTRSQMGDDEFDQIGSESATVQHVLSFHPIPFRSTLTAEIENLFPDSTMRRELEGIVYATSYPVDIADVRSSGEAAHRLVESMKANDVDVISRFLGRMSQARPGSMVLKRAFDIVQR